MSEVLVPRRCYSRSQRSIYQVHYSLKKRDADMARPFPFYSHMHVQEYESQVAGHTGLAKCPKSAKPKYLGLLQCNGLVLKPIIKESLRREIEFYERLTSSTSPVLSELLNYIPKYYGCRQFTFNGHENEYVMLEDLADNMIEPCIIDIKIGKRTWDPLATEAKIAREKSKYSSCKEEYSFCIPGYQVYKLNTGQLVKHGKDYGKKLYGHHVRDALKQYLNAVDSRVCRGLLIQILSVLWRIQRWCSADTELRLYSSSVLIIYDARGLRECCGDITQLSQTKLKCRPNTLPRRRTNSVHSHTDQPTSFSGQLSPNGPIYKNITTVSIAPLKEQLNSFTTPTPQSSYFNDALQKITNLQSNEDSFERKLSKIKLNYRNLVDELANENKSTRPWVKVRLIDFAHAFFDESEKGELDTNFKEGIDSLVEVFEQFLKETEDQI